MPRGQSTVCTLYSRWVRFAIFAVNQCKPPITNNYLKVPAHSLSCCTVRAHCPRAPANWSTFILRFVSPDLVAGGLMAGTVRPAWGWLGRGVRGRARVAGGAGGDGVGCGARAARERPPTCPRPRAALTCCCFGVGSALSVSSRRGPPQGATLAQARTTPRVGQRRTRTCARCLHHRSAVGRQGSLSR